MSADTTARSGSRGRWVYLPEDIARQHPLYGVYGWALALCLLLYFGPALLLYLDMFSVPRHPEHFWLVPAADVLFLIACWISGKKLGGERPEFGRWFYGTAVLGLAAAVLFMVVFAYGLSPEYEDVGAVGFVLRAIPILAAVAYVALSRRVSVTTRKRVTANDPFLRAQWMTERQSGLRPRGGTAAARPFRKAPIDPSSIESSETTALEPDVGYIPPAEPASAGNPNPVDSVSVPPVPGAATVPAPGAGLPSLRRHTPPVPSSGVWHSLNRPTVPGGVQSDEVRMRRMENALLIDRLRRLQLAHHEGLITDDEMRAKRAELLREF